MEKRNNHCKCSFGIWIVIAGSVYLLFNLGILPVELKSVVFSWPSFLVVLGFIWMFSHHYIAGIVAVVAGLFFLMPDLASLIGFDYSGSMIHGIIWPLIIIFIGIYIITHPFGHYHFHRHDRKYSSCKSSDMEGVVDYNYFLSGADEIFLSPVFRGGEINVALGGMKLDLRKTSLSEGDTILEINSFLGGVSIMVPSDWDIEIHSKSLLGSFVDNRNVNGVISARKLIIITNSFMGGGDIRC